MKFPPVRSGAKGDMSRDITPQHIKRREDSNLVPDFQPTILREKLSKSPEPVQRLANQRCAGKPSAESRHPRHLRRTKSNDINPGQAFSPSQHPRLGSSPWATDVRAGLWMEKNTRARIPAFVCDHPTFRASTAGSRKVQPASLGSSEHAQKKAATKTNADVRIRRTQTVQDQTSSSSCSSQSASPSRTGSRLCTIPKDVIQKFGLRSNSKPDRFDREGELKVAGGSLKAAAVSYGGRTNWNWKKENQDSFLMEYSEKNDLVLLGIFDGHGVNGRIASSDVRNQLVDNLHKPDGVLWNRIKQDPEKAMRETFAEIDSNLCQRKVDWSRSGTTGVVVVIDSCWILTAWVGDSRAVLGQKKGTLSSSVVDSLGTRAGPCRVYLKYEWQPGLATSRAFGDTMAKIVGVTSEPECHHRGSNPLDKFIIVASDGVWEVVSSQEAVEIANAHPNPRKAANALVAVSLQRWLAGNNSRVCDDITAVVFFFDHKKDHRSASKRRADHLPILHT